MGFFDLFKKNATCARCNATIAAGDAQTLNGRQFCSSCYRRLKQQGQTPARQTPPRDTGRQGGGNSVEDKLSGKYGKGGSTGGYSAPTGGSSKSGGYSAPTGSSGTPATILDIKRVLDETKTKYREESNGKQWEIVTGFSGKDKNYIIKFISTGPQDDALAIRVFGIVSAEKSQYPRIYPVLQSLQDTYRYLRFTLDRDGDVNVEFDVTCLGKDAGLVALEMIVRITKILDDAYPQLKRAAYL